MFPQHLHDLTRRSLACFTNGTVLLLFRRTCLFALTELDELLLPEGGVYAGPPHPAGGCGMTEISDIANSRR